MDNILKGITEVTVVSNRTRTIVDGNRDQLIYIPLTDEEKRILKIDFDNACLRVRVEK